MDRIKFYFLNLVLILISSIQLACSQGFESAHRFPSSTHAAVFSSSSLNELPTISAADDANAADITFGRLASTDFNNDNYADPVICSGTGVIIRNGHPDISEPLFQEVVDVSARPQHERRTSCEITYLTPGKPSIIYAANWRTDWVGAAVQKVILNKGDGNFRILPIKFRNELWWAMGRGVKCTPYPQSLVNSQRKAGSLCFFADYNGQSALVKIEASGDNNITVRDLSLSSGILWNGSYRSNWGLFGILRVGNSNRVDGSSIMDGAFIDINGDSLPDLVTVGQHASIRSHRMSIDESRNQGIAMSNDIVQAAVSGGETEYLRVRSFNDIDKGINIPCVYFSGEGHEGTNDHVRCAKDNQLQIVDLPVDGFSSQMINASIKASGTGKIFIKTRNVASREDHLFSLPYSRQGIIGKVTARKTSEGILLKGYSCEKNRNFSMQIEVYSKAFNDPSKILYLRKNANIESKLSVRKKCLQPRQTSKNFNFTISNSTLSGGSRRFYVYAKVKSKPERVLLGTVQYTKSNRQIATARVISAN